MNKKLNRLAAALKDHDGVTRQHDGSLKLDLDLGLEGLWQFGMIASGITVLCLGVPALVDPTRLAGVGLPIAVVAFAVTGMLRWLTDNYYVIDPTAGELLYHRRFGPLHRVRVLGSLDDVVGVGVTGRKRSSKYRRWWEYRVLVVFATGMTIGVTEWSEAALDTCGRFGERIAKTLGVPFTPGEAERKLTVEVGRPDGVQITLRAAAGPWRVIALVVLLIVGVVVAAGLLVRP